MPIWPAQKDLALTLAPRPLLILFLLPLLLSFLILCVFFFVRKWKMFFLCEGEAEKTSYKLIIWLEIGPGKSGQFQLALAIFFENNFSFLYHMKVAHLRDLFNL